MSVLLRIFVVLVFSASMLLAKTSVSGKVTAADGGVPAMAHVHLAHADGSIYKPLISARVDGDGAFKFDIDGSGNYMLFITAVDHYGLQIPLPLNGEGAIKLNVRLQHYRYGDMKNVKILGDWNKFRFSAARPMEKQADGSWLFELKSDKPEVGYQLINVEATGHSVNGTAQDGFAYDGGGDYISVISVKGGQARIVFDPSRLKRSGEPARVTFDNSPALQKIYDLYAVSLKNGDAINRKMRAYKKEHGSTDGFVTDWDEYLRLYDAYLNDPDGEVRRFAAVQYARPAVPAQRKSALEKIVSLAPYNDPFWSYAPEALVDVYTGLSKEGGDELFAHVERIASERARGIVLISAGMKAMMDGDKQKLAGVYRQLKAGYANNPEFDYYIRMFDPNQRIARGKEVPAFEVKLIDSDRTVSNRSLLGSYYLMDFWAVWCGPCRAEMPNLHKAWEKYKGANFKILSLSFDPRVGDVEKYRKGEWPMPWLHTFVDGGFRSDLAKAFEVRGIPKPVLVGPDGRIVAVGIQLRGENLDKTLERVLKK